MLVARVHEGQDFLPVVLKLYLISCVRSKRERKAALQDKVIAEGFVFPKLFKKKIFNSPPC